MGIIAELYERSQKDSIELMMPIKVKPYEHQKKAFAFACDKFGVFDGKMKSCGTAFLMEMGTGKTISSISVAGCMYRFEKIDRLLIVAPLSILGVWEEEFAKFADFPYSLTVLKGTAAKKKEQLKNLPNDGLQVVVVNYETAWRLEKELLVFNADMIIADEAHKLKENRTSQSKGMHHLGDKAKYKLLLTGTVITNRELDVFSQYRFLNPQIFGTSFYTFRNRYFDMGGYGNHTPVFRQWMKEEFLEKLHSAAFRVTKAECLDLPAVTEEIRSIELEKNAAELYSSIEDESYAQLDDSEVTTANILTRLLRLSQITGGHLTDDDGVLKKVSTAKLDALSDIIDSATAEDKKLVIMARFVPELDEIQEFFEKKKIAMRLSGAASEIVKMKYTVFRMTINAVCLSDRLQRQVWASRSQRQVQWSFIPSIIRCQTLNRQKPAFTEQDRKKNVTTYTLSVRELLTARFCLFFVKSRTLQRCWWMITAKVKILSDNNSRVEFFGLN